MLYVVGRRMYFQIDPVVLSLFLSLDKRDSPPHPEPPDPSPVAAQSAMWGALRADSGPTAAEGKGEGTDAGEVPPWMLDAELPPPRGCRSHPNNTGLIKCGACAGARDLHTQFMSGEITHEEAVAAWGGLP